MGKEMVCKFCEEPPIQMLNGKPVAFSCGTRANDPSPRTVLCWTGWVMKLQKKITALEGIVMRKKPTTVREAAIAGGWHPDVKYPG